MFIEVFEKRIKEYDRKMELCRSHRIVPATNKLHKMFNKKLSNRYKKLKVIRDELQLILDSTIGL